ncbi:MAG TPA: peptide chain release factor N(5)-glutamine methyltransferase [Desulfuromonadales bacterium]|nr:peptide chain release factor N(5)-glutamine methyltransferase [Desulfuromonadales bacterium]
MAEVWTVLKVLQWTADYLSQKGVENGRRDAELLLGATLDLDRVGLYLNYDRPLASAELAAFRERVGRRARREPLQHILGRTEFWSLSFVVTPAVLIPRADTEVLVEEALKRAAGACSILDVGTGSGAVAVALAHELPAAKVAAMDVSAEALAVAMQNARSNDVEGRIRFLQADMGALPGGPYDLIVANPPYVPDGEISELMPEVRDFEPHLALSGGRDGLDCYRRLLPAAAACLKPDGWLLVEVGCRQALQVTELFQANGFAETFTARDLAAIERVVGGRLA